MQGNLHGWSNPSLAAAFCMENLLHGIIIFITTITLPLSGLFGHSKPALKPILTPTPTISISISPTPKNSPSKKTKESTSTFPTPTQYVITSTPIPLPSSNTTQNTKVDSSVRIELCRTNAEQQRMNYIQAGDNLLAQERPQIAELANTSNNQETENIALKYGLIKQSDIVRAADVYQKLINEGNPQDHAKSISESMANTWWAYLKNLHDWAVKERDNYRISVATKADNSKNDYYTKCLNYEK